MEIRADSASVSSAPDKGKVGSASDMSHFTTRFRRVSPSPGHAVLEPSNHQIETFTGTERRTELLKLGSENVAKFIAMKWKARPDSNLRHSAEKVRSTKF
jgi:hypothetical protein